MEQWQYKQIEALERIIKVNWNYIDIGACRGELLQFFSDKMKFGYAVEPDINNFNYLTSNFSRYNITFINKVISNINGIRKFWQNGSHMGNLLGHDMDYNNYSENNMINIESMTLDEFLKDKDIHFIKIDVEGAEWEIFEGAQTTLKNKSIIYQVEFHLDEDWNKRNILYDNNYEIYDLNYKKLPHDITRQYQAILIKK